MTGLKSFEARAQRAGQSFCGTGYLSWDHHGSTRMITDQNGNLVTRYDYLPFGETIDAGVGGRTNVWNAYDAVEQKFTRQRRDAETGLDFFEARYMSNVQHRFLSADPRNPQSWDAYAYVGNNPLNTVDPSGTCDVFAAGITMYPGEYSTIDQFVNNKIAVFPYAGENLLSGALEAATSGGDVPGLVFAIKAAISQTQPSSQVNLFGVSGGSQTIKLALPQLSSAELRRIGNITYLVPGNNPFSDYLPFGNGITTYVKGSGFDRLIPSARPPSGTYNLIQSSCGHDPSCIISTYLQELRNKSGSPCSTPGIVTPSIVRTSKGKVTSTITYGAVSGGSSSTSGVGLVFQPVYGAEGDFLGGAFLPSGTPKPPQLRPY